MTETKSDDLYQDLLKQQIWEENDREILTQLSKNIELFNLIEAGMTAEEALAFQQHDKK